MANEPTAIYVRDLQRNCAMDLREKIETHSEFLIDYMEPDFGMIDSLSARGALSWQQSRRIKDASNSFDRNEKLLDFVLKKKAETEFVEALTDTNQTHLVNYIHANGDYNESQGDEWPLKERELNILSNNQPCLVDLLDTCDLLNSLVSVKVINNKQQDFISSKATSYEKNTALLDILRRRSLSDYRKTIECLIETNQQHIAQILDEGGVVVRVHASLDGEDVTEEEDRIATSFANQLENRSLAESSRIWELTQLKIIAARKGQSVVLYVHCQSLIDLESLQDRLLRNELKTQVHELFSELLRLSGLPIRHTVVAVTISEEELKTGVDILQKLEISKRENENQHQDADISLSNGTICKLPTEMLDIILQKSYLLSVLRQTQVRDKEIILQLASVEFSWFQAIGGKKFKHIIWRLLAEYYGKKSERIVFYRSNRSYLEENIYLKGLIHFLRADDCLTDVQVAVISKKRRKDKTDLYRVYGDNISKFLNILRSFDDTEHLAFISCLCQNKQKHIARVSENGGVVVKVSVQSPDGVNKKEAMQQLVGKLRNIHDRKKPLRSQVEKCFSHWRDNSMEILNSLYDRDAVVWVWCQSQKALEKLQEMRQTGELIDTFRDLAMIQSDTGKGIHDSDKPKTANMDQDQLQRTVVLLLSVAVNFTTRLDVNRNKDVRGLTKLRNRIYVLCRVVSSSPPRCVILVFEDQTPFCLQKGIEIRETKYPIDIISSAMENCLYVLDSPFIESRSVWKIADDYGDNQENNITKWLDFGTEDQGPSTLSFSSEGHLLTVSRQKGDSDASYGLRIFGPDAELLLSVELPKDVRDPLHAVETSTGDFFILHRVSKEKEEGEQVERWIWVVSKVSRDGKTVACRFIPEIREQLLSDPDYLAVDSLDRIFLADFGKGRVIFLDSNLRWKRILIPSKAEEEEGVTEERVILLGPWRLFYDKEKKQLIVGGGLGGASVYTLNYK